MSKKILSTFLMLCMVLTMLSISAMAEEGDGTIGARGEIIAFVPLEQLETEKTVTLGTSIEDLELPKTLTVTVRTNPDIVPDSVYGSAYEESLVDIPVAWTSQPEYDGNTQGEYVFTPVLEGYIVSAELPRITTTVEAALPLGMDSPMDVTEYDIWVAGVQVTDANKGSITGPGISGKVTYDSDTNALTLTDVTITYGVKDAIYTNMQDLMVVLNGENSVTSTSYGDHNALCTISKGSFTFKGTGSLYACGTYSGIYAFDNIIIESGTITASGQKAGISCNSGSMVISGGNVTGTATTHGTRECEGYGIARDHNKILDLTVTGDTTVTAMGKKGAIGPNTFNATNTNHNVIAGDSESNAEVVASPDESTWEKTYVKLLPGNTISGTITSDEGSSIGGATIQIQKDGADFGTPVTTAEEGTYTTQTVPNGNYTIKVSKSGYSDAVIADIIVSGSPVTGKDLALTKTVTFIPVADITMTNVDSVQVNTDLTLVGTVSPDTATNGTITWSVEKANGTRASISGNTFRATEAGTATVKATVINGLSASSDYIKNFTLTVTEAPVATYTITYDANGGIGSMANGTATEGESFTLPANGFTAPDGKRFKAWAIGSASGEQVNVGATYTFTKNTTVYAVWEDIPVVTYTISATAGTGGIISPSGSVTVNNGASQTFTITPNSNYSIADVKVDNVSQGKVTSYTFNNVTANHTISATFSYTGGSGGSGSSSSGKGNSVIVTPTAPDKPDSPTQGEIKVPGKVDSKGNVTVNITDKTVIAAFDKALEDAKKKGNEQNGITLVLRVDTGSKAPANVTVNLPKAVQEIVISKRIVNTIVVVDNPNIKIGMDLATVEEINRQANSDVNVTAARGDGSKLTDEAKRAIGNRPVFDLKVNYGSGKQVQNFGAGNVSVAIPYTLGANEKAENVKAVYIDGNGKLHWLTSSVYDSVEKVLRFSTNHFSTYGVGCKEEASAFTDIAGHWAKEDIEFVVSRGLFRGTSETTFSPNTEMTRGMFVTVLGRLANADVSNYKESSFSDVKSDAYYMGYIEWARKNRIINGIGNGTFAPEQSITREQMAVIMQNYAKVIGFTLPKVHGENTFADNERISAYAKDAVKQMQMAGVLNGKNGNLFDPQGSATRAEVSAVLCRFIELALSSDTI